MRAIINFKMEHKLEPVDLREELYALIDNMGFMPMLDQNDEIIMHKKNEIMKDVHEDDKVLVERTFLLTVFHEATKTWGVVNVGTSKALTVRLKNSVEGRLKWACEDLISCISEFQNKKIIKLKPIENLEVFEPASEYPAYAGRVIPHPVFWLAISEKKYEAYTALVSFALASIVIYMTSPFSDRLCYDLDSGNINLWICSNLEKLGGALLVSFVLSLVAVILHWVQLNRTAPIQW